MANRKTKLTVGIFVISGICLAVLAVIWLGVAHIFEKGMTFAAYFDESVQGLQKDSAVKYRGVAIGRVDSIHVAPDGNLIEVLMKIESDLDKPDEVIAQLKSIGITGLVFIELEQKSTSEKEHRPEIDFPTRYPVIATKTSNMANIFEEAEDLLTRMNKFDFIGISNNLQATITQINNTVKEADLAQLTREFNTTVKKAGDILDPRELRKITDSAVGIRNDVALLTENANKTVSQFQDLLSSNEPAINESIANLKNSLVTADNLMGKGINLIDSAETNLDTLQNRMHVTLDHLEQASISLSQLIDSINRQPSQLLFGDPPKPKKIEE
jgi:phospholipid/cholesterol/gamma-HCH transport system substrate-binding protein